MTLVSFCHPGSEKHASYRYRCWIPAAELGAAVNNPIADVLVFAKPCEQDVPYAQMAKAEGRRVIVDVCDPHLQIPCYRSLIDLADVVTCPTDWMATFLHDETGCAPVVVPDPYEFPQIEPHCNGDMLLWFGHPSNMPSLIDIAPSIADQKIMIVTNADGAIPYSRDNMLSAFLEADIVLMPETAPYKSANRTVEAIRQGCFVVAHPHPAINHIPGIWRGNIRKGIEWAQSNRSEANARTREAQAFIEKQYSPKTVASAWRKAVLMATSCSTSDAAIASGTDG